MEIAREVPVTCTCKQFERLFRDDWWFQGHFHNLELAGERQVAQVTQSLADVLKHTHTIIKEI